MTYVGAAVMIAGLIYYVIVDQKEAQKAMEAKAAALAEGDHPSSRVCPFSRKLPGGMSPGVLLFVLVICAPPTSAERSGVKQAEPRYKPSSLKRTLGLVAAEAVTFLTGSPGKGA